MSGSSAVDHGPTLAIGVAYHELGEEFFYRRDTEHTKRYRRRLIRQLERLGHNVTLDAAPQPA